MSSIFISYSHADKLFVQRLVQDLELSNIDVWLDEVELRAGDSVRDKISKAIDGMEYVGVVLSSNSVDSVWVKDEVDIALEEEKNLGKVKVLPILIEECKIIGFLRGRYYIDFRSESKYENELIKLIDGIKNRSPKKNKILRVATHKACFVHDQIKDYYFINITNISDKPIVITHVWYSYNGCEVFVLHDLRRLPVRLEINQPWETWLLADKVPEADREIAFSKFIVKLSTGEKIISKRDYNVPRHGAVPGGPDLTDMHNK